MIKPASALCNLRCKYCFYADVARQREIPSFGVMEKGTAEVLLEKLREQLCPGDSVTLIFQGGEPTLAGLEFFRHFTACVSLWGPSIRVAYAIQTNGTLLDEDWCRFFREHRFLVGISFDILRSCHDTVRVDSNGAGTCRKLEQTLSLLTQERVEYNVLCTLTRQIARHPQQVWKRILQLDLRYVQFTPCLAELDAPGESVYSLTPRRFADFYIPLFSLWYESYRKGAYRSIKLFDDLVNYLAFGVPGSCGMGGSCQPQLVVEADGSTYPCDFFCLDRYCLGNMLIQPIQTLLTAPAMGAFLHREYSQPQRCGVCRFLPICGGGCKRMQQEVCCSGDEPFCGYSAFLEAALPRLLRIAEAERTLRQRIVTL